MDIIPKINIETIANPNQGGSPKYEPEALTEDQPVPPLGHLRVSRHQASVDIGLLTHRAPRLHPDLLAEVQERVHEGGGDRREREAVGEREGGGEEERAVLLVLCDVNRRVVVNDLRYIV